MTSQPQTAGKQRLVLPWRSLGPVGQTDSINIPRPTQCWSVPEYSPQIPPAPPPIPEGSHLTLVWVISLNGTRCARPRGPPPPSSERVTTSCSPSGREGARRRQEVCCRAGTHTSGWHRVLEPPKRVRQLDSPHRTISGGDPPGSPLEPSTISVITY